MPPTDQLLVRIRGEFGEMPVLRLTLAQACRLWQMDTATCEVVPHTLVEDLFLTRTPQGAFMALPMPRAAAPVKAGREGAETTERPMRRSA